MIARIEWVTLVAVMDGKFEVKKIGGGRPSSWLNQELTGLK